MPEIGRDLLKLWAHRPKGRHRMARFVLNLLRNGLPLLGIGPLVLEFYLFLWDWAAETIMLKTISTPYNESKI